MGMKKVILIVALLATPAFADGPSSPWDRPQLTIPHPGHLCYSPGWKRENFELWDQYCLKFDLPPEPTPEPELKCTTVRYEVEGATPRWQTKEVCEPKGELK